MCKIITVANQKGGVTKTTIGQHLSYILAEEGRRVLCVDFDPQTNLSATLLPDGQAPALNISGVMARLLEDQDLPAPSSYIQRCGKVDLIPGSKDLSKLETSLLTEMGTERFLQEILSPLRSHYDYIIIDTNRAASPLMTNALTAADSVLIPLCPEFYSIFGGVTGVSDRGGAYAGSVQAWLPVKDILKGVVITRDKRFIKILELLPVNFYTMSELEKGSAIADLAAYLKIAPSNLQINVLTQKFDLNSYRKMLRGERNERCREMIEESMDYVPQMVEREAVTHRFFLSFSYDPGMKAADNTPGAIAALLNEKAEVARRDSLPAEKVSWLSVWYSLQKRGLTEEDRSYIDSSLIECYGRFGITFDNASLFEEDGETLKEMPMVKDWYDLLLERPETRHLAVVLTRYVSGSAASMGGQTNVDTDDPYIVIDRTGLSDDLHLAAVYAATGFATDVIVQNGDVGTALLSDELWKLLGANSNPLAADYTMQMVKLIRSQGGIAGVTSQGMADMMALDGGKYGKGILDSCRVKFIMQMEEQEARLVQEKLALTEEETRMITRFRRGKGLLCIGHNHVPIAIHVSPKEYEAITTSPTDLRARLRQEE